MSDMRPEDSRALPPGAPLALTRAIDVGRLFLMLDTRWLRRPLLRGGRSCNCVCGGLFEVLMRADQAGGASEALVGC